MREENTLSQSHLTNPSVEGDAHRADGVVGLGRDLAGTPSPVLVGVEQIVPGVSTVVQS